KLVLTLLTGFLTIISMSTTGLILYILLFLLIVINKSIKIIINLKIKKRELLLGITLLLSLPFILLIIDYFLSTDIATISLSRSESNSADSRLRIWKSLISNKNILNFIVFGDGGNIMVNNRIYKPHNGHFHLIYSYGAIVYVIFMYIFFRIREKIQFSSFKRYFFIIAILIGFTINVGIYEIRFINIM